MSHASAALPDLALPDLRPLREGMRKVLAIGAGAAQVLGFAAVLWLIAAGPGLITDHASTVPLSAATSR